MSYHKAKKPRSNFYITPRATDVSTRFQLLEVAGMNPISSPAISFHSHFVNLLQRFQEQTGIQTSSPCYTQAIGAFTDEILKHLVSSPDYMVHVCLFFQIQSFMVTSASKSMLPISFPPFFSSFRLDVRLAAYRSHYS